jgi:hypothetical protein
VPAASLDRFLAGVNLGAEHERLMHVTVEWERSTAGALPPHIRGPLGELWRDRMVAEHRSVGIFSLYTLDLLGAGAPAEVLSLACRAALDEVRHTELFARLASCYSQQQETPPPGIPPMPDEPSMTLAEQVAREALHLSVMSETYSSVSLQALHERAVDPAVKQALGAVIADEVHHARMGWAFVKHLLDHDDGGALHGLLDAELVPMFDSYVRTIFGDPANLPAPSFSGGDLELARDHGYESTRDGYRLFVETMRDIWLPGLSALGLRAAGLDERYH